VAEGKGTISQGGASLEDASSSLPCVALITAGFVYRLIIAARPLKWLDGLTIPDDTYLSLTIARNLARGLGPLYGTAYTNGFQPLWVFLLAPLYALIPDDPDRVLRIGLVLLVAFETGMIVLVCGFVRRRGHSNLAAALVAGCWAFNPYFVKISLGGLETSLSALAVCATLVHLDRVRGADRDRAASLAGLGVLLGIAFLARVDAVFLIPAVALFLVPTLRSSSGVWRLMCRWGIVGSTAAAVVAPWLLYSYWYTGDVYPVSGRAVRLIAIGNRGVGPDGLWAFRRFLVDTAFRIFLQSHAWLLVMLGLLLMLLLALGIRRIRDFATSFESLAPGFLYGILLFFAYPLHILSFWFFDRYYFPLAILLLLAVGLVASFLFRLPNVRRVGPDLAAVLIAATIAFHLSRHETWRLLFSRDETTQGYRNIGLWVAKRFEPGTRIGSSQSGALGYFATNMTVVNLDGVVNRKCFDSVEAKRNIEYILHERVEYVIGWKVNIDFIRYYSSTPADDFLEPMGRVRGFQSWGNDWLLYRVRASPKPSPG
jgi:hypothetical protein